MDPVIQVILDLIMDGSLGTVSDRSAPRLCGSSRQSYQLPLSVAWPDFAFT